MTVPFNLTETPTTLQATIVFSPTSQPDLNTIIPSTILPSLETDPLSGYLFMYDSDGIRQVTLTDNTIKHLLVADAEWSNWDIGFAYNKKFLAYSIQKENEIELWFTPLPDWHPTLLLTVNDVAFDFAVPIWNVNDRYLLFELFTEEDDEKTMSTYLKALRTYVFDTETMEFVHQPYWPGECATLAPSPQTGLLAIWCNQTIDTEGKLEFFVLELKEEAWLTEEKPSPLTKECTRFKCAWSPDGKFVAYVNGDYPQLLFSVSVSDSIPIHMDDKFTDDFQMFPRWSPDEKYLYYTGECGGNGGSQNPTIMVVATQKVIWCLEETSNQGQYKGVNVKDVSWSPNGQYLAIPISPNIKTEILIIDVLTQQEVVRISDIDGYVADMVWVDD